ncbi:cytochrome c [Campylobacter sp.]|uniref:c-type cytochrome n=1 Tax=Campylobacter sp. TaxID=205 RepID=UPI0025B889EB|nr:cytochrome c [Campylobacter sp.]
MKFIFFPLFILINTFAEDFISPREYQESLYQNPRGISCAKCHGNGEKKILGYYMQQKEKVPFIVPSIKNIDYARFREILNKGQGLKSIMPTYSLTEEEIRSLYMYIKNNKDKQ